MGLMRLMKGGAPELKNLIKDRDSFYHSRLRDDIIFLGDEEYSELQNMVKNNMLKHIIRGRYSSLRTKACGVLTSAIRERRFHEGKKMI